MTIFQRFKPGVPKRTLYFLAGSVWAAAGLTLFFRGLTGDGSTYVTSATGLLAGVVFYRYMFIGLSNRHIRRFETMTIEMPCLFSFLDWRGYGIMTIMISGGALMGSLEVFPVSVVRGLLLAMGIPLLLSAFRFAGAGLATQQTPREDANQPQ